MPTLTCNSSAISSTVVRRSSWMRTPMRVSSARVKTSTERLERAHQSLKFDDFKSFLPTYTNITVHTAFFSYTRVNFRDPKTKTIFMFRKFSVSISLKICIVLYALMSILMMFKINKLKATHPI